MTTRIWPYYICYVLPLSLIAGMLLGGFWVGLPLLIIFVLIPLADKMIGTDHSNLDRETAKTIEKNQLFFLPLYLWAPLQVLLTLGTLSWALKSQNITIQILTGISLGFINGGIGINMAHELMHKSGALPRRLADTILSVVQYMHFSIEHVHGHHTHVATPADAVSARYNETIYRFLPRAISGAFRSSWNIEKKRCQKKNLAWHQNTMIRYLIIQLAWIIGVSQFFGLQGLSLYLLQAFVAILALEVVNYIEHYGMTRKLLENGRYQKTDITHSWNSDHLVSNFFLFNLQRHSNHHAYARRPYQVLRSYSESPQLPYSYPTLMILSLFPKQFKALMNPLVDQHLSRKLTPL